MAKSHQKTSIFALTTSAWITLILSMLHLLLLYYTWAKLWLVIPLGIVSFICIFFVLKYHTKQFISSTIEKIYKETPLSKRSSQNLIPSDISILKKEITLFAQDSKNKIEDLKSREDYRKEFIGNVSHELNTPLFMVQGYILTLLDGAMDDKNVNRKYLQRAAKGVERLIFIIKDLDMIAKLESGMLHLEYSNFNIVEVIQSAFELYEIQAKKRNISLIFDKHYSTIQVYADRERIQQVIANIIMNSIKYGRDNGTTEVSLQDLDTNKLLIQITDNGEGVAKENLHRLFERFYRVEKSRSRKQGGSGLGLSIVKHIIEAHQQRLFVESTLGVGSDFSFTLQKSEVEND